MFYKEPPHVEETTKRITISIYIKKCSFLSLFARYYWRESQNRTSSYSFYEDSLMTQQHDFMLRHRKLLYTHLQPALFHGACCVARVWLRKTAWLLVISVYLQTVNVVLSFGTLFFVLMLLLNASSTVLSILWMTRLSILCATLITMSS